MFDAMQGVGFRLRACEPAKNSAAYVGDFLNFCDQRFLHLSAFATENAAEECVCTTFPSFKHFRGRTIFEPMFK